MEFDEYQKKMFELFNELIDIKTSGAESKEYIDAVNAINENARQFFSTEEKYLKKKAYPDLSAQMKAHRRFLKFSMGLRREMAEDESALNSDSIEKLRDRLINHILNEDSLYVPFMNLSQYIEDCKRKR